MQSAQEYLCEKKSKSPTANESHDDIIDNQEASRNEEDPSVEQAHAQFNTTIGKLFNDGHSVYELEVQESSQSAANGEIRTVCLTFASLRARAVITGSMSRPSSPVSAAKSLRGFSGYQRVKSGQVQGTYR